MSSTRPEDFMWYFDSDQDYEDDKDKSTEPRSFSQPWRAYWPPKCQELIETWLLSESPEVLWWRFDRNRPFDRPWRAWTRSACAMKEEGAVSLSQQPVAGYRGQLVSKCPRPFQAAPSKNPRSGDVDDLIKRVRLYAVNSALFNFLAPLDSYNIEKPYLSRLPCGTNLARTNIVTESHAINVFDVSGHESAFTLEKSGFQFEKCPVQMQQWNDLSVCSDYIPRIEKWLIQQLKCTSVFIYAYNFRGKPPDATGTTSGKKPFLRAHCDATAASCLKRLQLYFPDASNILMKERVRFLNLWRTICTPVQDCPLALCDFRTCKREDFVPADIIFPHYQDEAYEILHNPDQRWFYKRRMESDDILLFKLGDNSRDEAPCKLTLNLKVTRILSWPRLLRWLMARGCPHSAFMDPSVPKGTPGRVSIEIRAIVIG